MPQVAALRPPIKLDRARASTHFRPPEAEHARSYGTAASAAGKYCCLTFYGPQPLGHGFLHLKGWAFEKSMLSVAELSFQALFTTKYSSKALSAFDNMMRAVAGSPFE